MWVVEGLCGALYRPVEECGWPVTQMAVDGVTKTTPVTLQGRSEGLFEALAD